MTTLHLKKIRSLIENMASGKNTLVMAFGRFQPPTIGHALLINTVRHTAEKHHAQACVFVSTSHDSSKNPLQASEKIHYLSKMFPGLNFAGDPSEGKVRGIIGIFKHISVHGFGDHKIDNIILVAGSDRVPEFKTKLNSYNGKSYNFDSIDVVSAGERDPDDEGVGGMSGTKMRAAAKNMDFNKFRAGIPKTLSDQDTKELMMKIRLATSVNESFRGLDGVLLSEGVYDQSIFKAIFLLGGSGSGKDFVLHKTLMGHGLVEINSDNALEYFMDKENLSKRMPEHEADRRYVVRQKAKSLTKKKMEMVVNNRQGLILNGTGDNPSRFAELKSYLESLGYECKCIFVVTTDEVSKKRNIERGHLGGRTVPENIRSLKWRETIAAKDYIKQLFGDKNFIEFDNSVDLRTAPDDIKFKKQAELMDIFKNIRKFSEKTPSSPIAKAWIRAEKDKKKRINEQFDESFSIDELFESTFFSGKASEPVIDTLSGLKLNKKEKKKINKALVPVVILKKKKRKVVRN